MDTNFGFDPDQAREGLKNLENGSARITVAVEELSKLANINPAMAERLRAVLEQAQPILNEMNLCIEDIEKNHVKNMEEAIELIEEEAR